MAEETHTALLWQAQAQQEIARILAVLGEVTTGGIVERIEHTGATSVPGLPRTPPLDLALSVVPFPVDAAQLDALDYLLTSESNQFEQRALHRSGRFQLFISEAGSDEWTNHLLVRDFLRHDEQARQRFATYKVEATAGAGEQGKDAFFAQLLQEAAAWWPRHVGFAPVDFVAKELARYDRPWYISSGWALDLFLRRVTRVHHDVDVVVAHHDHIVLRELLEEQGWKLVTPYKGRLELWPPHMRLETPRHQIHAHREGNFIDFLLTDLRDGVWRYRRAPKIIRNLEQAVKQSPQGLPYLAPEIVLLFKSKNTGNRERSKDQMDFEQVQPHLDAEARAWLRWALIATEPAHPWIAQL